MEINLDFWKNKKVLVTGHTGFKGSWLSLWLAQMGSKVVGVSLDPPTNPSLYSQINLNKYINSLRADIGNKKALSDICKKFKPEVIFHLAAQPLVVDSYKDPYYTFQTNFIGSLNILEIARSSNFVKSCIMVTTDKVYENKEQNTGYIETDSLNGSDPYSASKASTEILINSYIKSYFNKNGSNFSTKIASVRAGNVIGGGDWANDRIIPDAVRSFLSGDDLKIRNPQSIRPWQNVLEPLGGYIILAQKLYEESNYSGGWNFGPNETDHKTVLEVISMLKKDWKAKNKIIISQSNNYIETKILKLNCTKAYKFLNWAPIWNLEKTIKKLTNWYKEDMVEKKLIKICISDIEEYISIYNQK